MGHTPPSWGDLPLRTMSSLAPQASTNTYDRSATVPCGLELQEDLRYGPREAIHFYWWGNGDPKYCMSVLTRKHE